MRRKRFVQFRISHLLWLTLVVAAFLCGRHFPERSTPTATPIVATVPASGAPLAFDFAYPMASQTPDSEVFSFSIGLKR